jgi:Ca2+-dependent lipid-binding protein
MDFEGTSDVFCRGFFDSKEDVQETDTHYRNQDGKPDFQYRLIYKMQYPRKNNDYKFTLQMYDRDFFKSNDMIGSAQIDLKNLIEDSSLTKQPLCLNDSYYKDVLGTKFPSKLTFD